MDTLAMITIAIAFVWLGQETNWLRARLPAGPGWPHADLELETDEDCDDYCYVAELGLEFEAFLDYEARYQAWLTNVRYKPMPVPRTWIERAAKRDAVDPRDRWQADDEDKEERQSGEQLWQRHGVGSMLEYQALVAKYQRGS